MGDPSESTVAVGRRSRCRALSRALRFRSLRSAAVAGLFAISTIGSGGAATAGNVDVAPSKTLIGASTGLSSPFGVAFDRDGAMYVSNGAISTVTAYAGNWESGNTAPTRTLIGASTELAQPRGIAFDSVGNMYVANFATEAVTAYAAGWATGNTAPTKVLSGLDTGIVGPVGIGFDTSDRMYVANSGNSSVTMYTAGWATGNTAPAKTLVGESTGLNAPWAIAFDSGGAMHVTSAGGSSAVTAYVPEWATGDTAPTKILTGSSTGVDTPAGIAFGPGDAMHVTSFWGNRVTVHAAGWRTGNTAPTRILTGAATGLDTPSGIAFDASGNPHVANMGFHGILAYGAFGAAQSITFAQLGDTMLNAGPVAVSVSASSGLPVSLASATPETCSVAGDQVTLVAVGTCTVTASQPGNSTYLEAAQVSRSFAVTRVPAAANLAQSPTGGCVTMPGRLRVGRKVPLMRAGCMTNAGQVVAVRVAARSRAARAGSAQFELSCQVGRKRRQPAVVGYGPGYHRCTSGELLLRAAKKKRAVDVTWLAPAVTGYDSFFISRTYRT